MLAEARKHREWHVLKTCPGLGPIRIAELLPVVVTPYRFRSRSAFWAYCGLGIVMRSSSDWVRKSDGGVDEDAGTADSGPEPELQPHG